ncbi:acyltransferase [Natronococcus wangiae]|uniref:acyltransferase n=1 Tax=Natronococcus wangiae TaxID=3068275 RepID=UPI00273E249C|nr:acyltransferase [Natronococcus sp. AD5]
MAGRIYSIDSMRIIAMAFIVSIHTDLLRGVGEYGTPINFVIDSSARFAVPFFFVTAGYFFALKTTRRDPIAYFAERAVSIASLYAFGLVLTVPVFLAGSVVREGADRREIPGLIARRTAEFVSPIDLLYYGNSVSEILWFLPALIFSLGLICLISKANMTELLLPIAFGFHGIGLLGASYTMFVDIPFEVRDALFFGFFYSSLGYYIYSADWQPDADRSTLYLGATVLFGALHIAERYVLGYALTGETITQSVYTASYTIATVLVTISLFAFLLSRPNLGKSTPLPSWGNYAVGIYIAHPSVLFVLERAGEALTEMGYEIENTLLWHLVLTPGTFFGALLVYIAVRKLRAIEKGKARLSNVKPVRDRYSK